MERTHYAGRDAIARARADLGLRGTVYGYAYAYGHACGHYHVTPERATTRIPTHGKVRLGWRMNASQRGADPTVRTRTVDTRALVGVRTLAALP